METADIALSLRLSVDHLLEGVQVIGHDWTYVYVNAAAARHGHRHAGELIGRTMMACYPGIENTPMFATLSRVMRERRSERLLNEFTYPDGTRGWFELLIDPVPDGICVLSLDVTQREEAQAQLRQAQKMEALGQLAAGVAHDFNNVLTAILGFSALLAEQLAHDAPVGRDLREIVDAGERAAALTRQLLTFSRRGPQQVDTISPAATVEQMIPFLRRLLPANVHVRTRLDPDTAAVQADPTQLEQILLNLVVNARDAMLHGGTITVATATARFDAHEESGIEGLTPGTYAVISVTDTGIGMRPEVRSRVFEPFFTTKPAGSGTGLGLAAVASIVRQLQGHVWLYSEPGRGAVFKIYLPRTDAAPLAEAAAAAEPLPSGHERVLVVEYDAGVRSFERAVLERHGYRVVDVATAEEALARLAGADAELDLLITDMVLPGLDGATLSGHLRRLNPSLKVLFTSGYDDPSAAVSQATDFLEKPFTGHTLLTRVRGLLDRR